MYSRQSNDTASSHSLKRSRSNQPDVSCNQQREIPTYQVMFLAAPQRAEQIQKTMIAAETIGLRPIISETRPFSGVMIVAPKRYDYGQSLQATDAYRSDPRVFRWGRIELFGYCGQGC